MQKGKKKKMIFTLLVVFFPFSVVSAEELQQVETNGTIGFTGFYKPIGTPDPTPPDGMTKPPEITITKPIGKLPQTNETMKPWLIWFGVILISFVFIRCSQKRKKDSNKIINESRSIT